MLRGEASIDIHADADDVYALIADVTRVGDFSPECRRAEWLSGFSQPVVRARFRGFNSWLGFRWSRVCVITSAEPGREFSFETVKGRGIKNDVTRWRYTLDQTEGTTRVVETYELTQATPWIRMFEVVSGRTRGLVRGMRTTLESMKAEAERG